MESAHGELFTLEVPIGTSKVSAIHVATGKTFIQEVQYTN